MADIWESIHKDVYAKSDWIDKPSIFAETAITYFPAAGRVLELGAGLGQDSRFFAGRGYEVVSTDMEQTALDTCASKLTDTEAARVTFQRLDLRDKLPFADASFDVVYAHLSLHYFSAENTRQIFDDILRVLKPGGVLAFFTNSTSDPEYGTGEQIEPDYFNMAGMAKRYFSVRTAGAFAAAFDTELLDDKGETYKDMAKGVHNLIRFVDTKP